MQLIPKLQTAWSPIKRQQRDNAIANINQWARQNPDLVFNDNFKNQRQYLNNNTWQIIVDSNPNIKLGSAEYNMIPDQFRQQVIGEAKLTDSQKRARAVREKLDEAFSNRGPRGWSTLHEIFARDFKGIPFIYNPRKRTAKSESLNDYMYYRYLDEIENKLPQEMMNYDSIPSDDVLDAWKTRYYDLRNNLNTLRRKQDASLAEYLSALDDGHPYLLSNSTLGSIFSPVNNEGNPYNGSLANKAFRAWRKHIYNPSTQQQTVALNGPGTQIIDLSKNTERATPTSKLENILFNEFVEDRYPSIHKAGDYKNLNLNNPKDENGVPLIGDLAKFPATNVSIFAGVEDGKYKAGPIDIFNPQTLVYPARNVKSNLKPITKFNLGQDADDTLIDTSNYYRAQSHLNDKKAEELDKVGSVPYQNLSSYKSGLLTDNMIAQLKSAYPPETWTQYTFGDRIKYPYTRDNLVSLFSLLIAPGRSRQEQIDDLKSNISQHPFITEFNNRDVQFLSKISDEEYNSIPKIIADEQNSADSIYNKYNDIRTLFNSLKQSDNNAQSTYGYTDVDGNTSSISDWNASILDGKFILANPNGGVYVGRVQDMNRDQLNWLNDYLSKNPSYVVRPDLGGFGQAYLNKPTYKKYISQYNENLDSNDPNIYAVGTNNKPMTDFTIK